MAQTGGRHGPAAEVGDETALALDVEPPGDVDDARQWVVTLPLGRVEGQAELADVRRRWQHRRHTAEPAATARRRRSHALPTFRRAAL